MTETSPREEGDNEHCNQLGTKAAAMARTVVVTRVRVTTMAAGAMATGAKRAMVMIAMMATMATMAMMATMVTMMPNSDVDAKQRR
jgi:hypothetical protein